MKIYIGIVIFIMIVTGIYVYYEGEQPPAATQVPVNSPVPTAPVGNTVGSLAPVFRLQSYTGVDIGIADFRNVEGIVLYFWSVSCGPCSQDLSTLIQLQDRYQNRFLPLAINRGDALADARGFSDRAGSSSRFPHLLDPADSIYRLYGGSGMPYYVFIDRNGMIRVIESGTVGGQTIEQDLQKIL